MLRADGSPLSPSMHCLWQRGIGIEPPLFKILDPPLPLFPTTTVLYSSYSTVNTLTVGHRNVIQTTAPLVLTHKTQLVRLKERESNPRKQIHRNKSQLVPKFIFFCGLISLSLGITNCHKLSLLTLSVTNSQLYNKTQS